jgi:UDP-hydrolysing UDP-N-acetyl-D-glucosamine 2-epimerase
VRTIGVVTTSRADYSHYLPLLRAISEDPELRLQLIVSGMHLVPEFGLTVKEIEADGFPIAARVETLLGSDTPEAIAKSMGLAVISFAQLFAANRPDILVVFGDRFEMHAAALAILPFNVPVAHVGGGDVTEGAIDESLRHGITKLSHLHFVASQLQAQRVLQMGEEPWRVTVTGELSLDLIHLLPKILVDEMDSRFQFSFGHPFVLVTYHPVTLEYEHAGEQIAQLLNALNDINMPVLFTAPNADTAGRIIARAIHEYVDSHPRCQLVANMGAAGYFTAMSLAAAMVGNSSSGVIEAASFRLPVVNIGNRQRGRLRGRNVIDCGYFSGEIVSSIKKAVSGEFRASLEGLTNPYGAGDANSRIVHQLRSVTTDDALLFKRFADLRVAEVQMEPR